MTLTFTIEIDGKIKKVTESLKKCRALVYKKYKRYAQLRVYVSFGKKIFDTFYRMENGYLKSVSGYPLYI